MRLIDADGLLEELRESCKWHAENSREFSLLYRDINIVKEQPTVDAVPVEFVKESIEILKFNGMLSGALLFETLLNDWKANTEGSEE